MNIKRLLFVSPTVVLALMSCGGNGTGTHLESKTNQTIPVVDDASKGKVNVSVKWSGAGKNARLIPDNTVKIRLIFYKSNGVTNSPTDSSKDYLGVNYLNYPKNSYPVTKGNFPLNNSKTTETSLKGNFGAYSVVGGSGVSFTLDPDLYYVVAEADTSDPSNNYPIAFGKVSYPIKIVAGGTQSISVQLNTELTHFSASIDGNTSSLCAVGSTMNISLPYLTDLSNASIKPVNKNGNPLVLNYGKNLTETVDLNTTQITGDSVPIVFSGSSPSSRKVTYSDGSGPGKTMLYSTFFFTFAAPNYGNTGVASAITRDALAFDVSDYYPDTLKAKTFAYLDSSGYLYFVSGDHKAKSTSKFEHLSRFINGQFLVSKGSKVQAVGYSGGNLVFSNVLDTSVPGYGSAIYAMDQNCIVAISQESARVKLRLVSLKVDSNGNLAFDSRLDDGNFRVSNLLSANVSVINGATAYVATQATDGTWTLYKGSKNSSYTQINLPASANFSGNIQANSKYLFSVASSGSLTPYSDSVSGAVSQAWAASPSSVLYRIVQATTGTTPSTVLFNLVFTSSGGTIQATSF
jgi:hypothetical protein